MLSRPAPALSVLHMPCRLCRVFVTAASETRASDVEFILSAYSQKPKPFVIAMKSWPACTRVCIFKCCLIVPCWLSRRPATPSAESRGSEIESVFSASSQKLKPFITAVKSRPAHDKVSDWLRKDSYGQVPDYLMERQIEMAAQLAEEEVCYMIHIGFTHHFVCGRQ